MGDLNQDQRAVYQSILPSVFTYDNFVFGERGRLIHPDGDQPDTVTLTHDEESGVRLRFSKSIGLGVRLQGGGTSAVAAQPADWRKPGQPALDRKDTAVEDQNYLYGVQIRKVVDNRLKPSNLAYKGRSLDKPLLLAPNMTIDEICKSASSASGLKVIADARIGSVPIQTAGVSSRPGDVLQALALCITGAYRKVGDVYVLTSDLEGIGNKRLRLALWKWDIDTRTRKRERAWQEAIRTHGSAQDITFEADGLPLNDAMTKFLDSDRGPGRGKTMPTSELTPQWQQVLMKGQSQFSDDMVIRTDIAEPTEHVTWNFVLPDGRDLLQEGPAIGQLNALLPRSGPAPVPPPTVAAKPILIRTDSNTSLMFKTDNPDVAASLPSMAQTHGFSEIWIQTWNPTSLAKLIAVAKTRQMGVRLVVKPWELPKGSLTTDPDVTLLGNTAQQATSLQEQTQWWLDAQLVWGMAPTEVGNLIGPADSMRALKWQELVNLTKTPGLSGSVVCQTEPPGYEPTVSREMYAPDELMFIGDFGYTQALRSQFVAEHSVDPVDFVDDRLRLPRLDLSLPLFGDPRRIRPRSRDPLEEPSGSDLQWLKLRSEANHSAISELLNQIPGPIFVQQRATAQDRPLVRGFPLTPWNRGTELPTTALGPNELESGLEPDTGWVWPLGFPMEPAVASRINQNLTRHIERHAKSKLAIDMSSIPPAELEKQLDNWFQFGATTTSFGK